MWPFAPTGTTWNCNIQCSHVRHNYFPLHGKGTADDSFRCRVFFQAYLGVHQPFGLLGGSYNHDRIIDGNINWESWYTSMISLTILITLLSTTSTWMSNSIRPAASVESNTFVLHTAYHTSCLVTVTYFGSFFTVVTNIASLSSSSCLITYLFSSSLHKLCNIDSAPVRSSMQLLLFRTRGPP